jgi:putative tRNA adenosine deaminase-associated protein
MSYFAALLVRAGSSWSVTEAALDGCESIADIGDVLRDSDGDVRLVVIEQDDEYAAIVRLDEDSDVPRAFLSDGHAADSYAVAGYIAEDLDEVGSSDPAEDDEVEDDDEVEELVGSVAVSHESVPLGDADIAEDLGTPAAELLRL